MENRIHDRKFNCVIKEIFLSIVFYQDEIFIFPVVQNVFLVLYKILMLKRSIYTNLVINQQKIYF